MATAEAARRRLAPLERELAALQAAAARFPDLAVHLAPVIARYESQVAKEDGAIVRANIPGWYAGAKTEFY